MPSRFVGERMQFDQLKRREFITLLGGAAAAWPLAARAQQAGKVFRIGFVGLPTADSLPKRPEAFRTGLRDLGIRRDGMSSSSTIGRTSTMNGCRQR
jgi:hypothetical protein